MNAVTRQDISVGYKITLFVWPSFVFVGLVHGMVPTFVTAYYETA